jgi:hypothetical protein
LDYLQWLGINAVWINPCFVSHFRDAGYDVDDYYRIAPRYGTNRDLYRLCREAHRHGIKVCLDLVAGHTSIDHPWFKASSRTGRSRYSDRYIWVPPAISKADTELSLIRGNSERDGRYVANCFDFQPALNYGFARPDQPWQQPVDATGPLENRKELIKIMEYWLGRGVDGFRVDMAFSLVKIDPGHKETIKLWQDIGQKVRTRYPEAALISEWGNPGESIAAGFDIDFMLHFGVLGYPDLMLNKNCFFRRSGGANIGDFLKSYLGLVTRTKGKGLISIPSSNHDIKRPCADRRTNRDLKVIFTFLLTWPGVPFIYYGDEIGMRYIPGLVSKEGGYDRTGSRQGRPTLPLELPGSTRKRIHHKRGYLMNLYTTWRIASVRSIRFRLIVSTTMIEAVLSRMIGTPAVLIFKKVDVVSRIASGVPMMSTKLSDRVNKIPATTIEKTRIDESDVRIGDPGPSLLCRPLPTRKNMARIKVSWITSRRSSIDLPPKELPPIKLVRPAF